MLPADHRDFSIENGSPVLDAFTKLILTLEVDTNFSYLALYTLFFDGSLTWCRVIPAVPAAAVSKPASACESKWANGSAQTAGVITGHDQVDGAENATVSAMYKSGCKNPLLRDLRAPHVQAAFSSFERTGQRRRGGNVYWVAKSFAIVDDVPYFVLTMTIRIHNATHHLGHSFGVLELQTVSAVLTSGLLTSGSRALLFDREGYLFAASSGVTVLDVNPTYNTTGRSKCYSAGVWSDVSARACQVKLSASSDPMIRKTAVENEQLFLNPPSKGRVIHTGEAFAFVETLPTLPGSMRLSLALVVPEQDVVGDAVTILPVCAAIAAGVVVVAAALVIAFLTVVLRPLHVIAENMLRAARFQIDVGEEIDVSVFAEMERAFIEMRDELSRIRAFVPQSLLRANDDDSDDIDDVKFLHTITAAGAGAKTQLQLRDDAVGLESAASGGSRLSASNSARPIRTCDNKEEDIHSPHSDGGVACSSISCSSQQITSPQDVRTPDPDSFSQAPVPLPHCPAQTRCLSLSLSQSASFTATRANRPLVLPSQSFVSPNRFQGPLVPAATATSSLSSGAAGRGLLEVWNGLRAATVSVVFVNLRGFHTATSATLCPKTIAATVSTVLDIVRQEKGVVDSTATVS